MWCGQPYHTAVVCTTTNLTIKKLTPMNDTFIVVTWPDVQGLFELEGWQENSLLINDMPLYSQYGSSSYMVRESWLRKQEGKLPIEETITNLESVIQQMEKDVKHEKEACKKQVKEAKDAYYDFYHKYAKIPRWIRRIFKAD